MRGTNYMVFSRETMKEIVEDYVERKYNWKDVEIGEFQQRKIHNALMFEATLTPREDAKRNPADET